MSHSEEEGYRPGTKLRNNDHLAGSDNDHQNVGGQNGRQQEKCQTLVLTLVPTIVEEQNGENLR